MADGQFFSWLAAVNRRSRGNDFRRAGFAELENLGRRVVLFAHFARFDSKVSQVHPWNAWPRQKTKPLATNDEMLPHRLPHRPRHSRCSVKLKLARTKQNPASAARRHESVLVLTEARFRFTQTTG
jgi:hypothetical protein